MDTTKLHIAVLGSTRGTGLQYIVDDIRLRRLPVVIELVISDKKDAFILQRAKREHILTCFIDPAGHNRQSYDRQVLDVFRSYTVDAIFFIGYMRIVSSAFVRAFTNRIYNVHPSLLPDFSGGMDLDVHRQVLQSGVKETGCTIHLVDEGVDTGPIVLQKRCPVKAGDTPEILKKRVQRLEGEVWIELLEGLIQSKFYFYYE